MADGTRISWTDATWNPVTGCTRVSAGCERCYVDWAPPFRIEGRHFTARCEACSGTGKAESVYEMCMTCGGSGRIRSNAIGSTTGVRLHGDRLDQPLRWRRPRRVFVNSLSDLFHDDVPDDFIVSVFAVMACASQHTFQVLTKRPARMRALLSSREFWACVAIQMGLRFADRDDDLAVVGEALKSISRRNCLPNVWLGVTVEDQKAADLRIPILMETPAAVRFLSCEPLLGAVDLARVGDGLVPFWCLGHGRPAGDCPNDLHLGREGGIDWVVVGGESGRGARPMHPDWARSLRDQCADAEVAFWFKQHGEFVEVDDPRLGDVWLLPDRHGAHGGVGTQPWKPGDVGAVAGRWSRFPDVVVRRVGKKAAGDQLDGRVCQSFPREV